MFNTTMYNTAASNLPETSNTKTKASPVVVLGIDHGYSNIKTANTCFKTGVIAHEGKPAFTNDLLVYDGHFYTIGEGHKEYSPIKTNDQDYYLLTLAAIARELSLRGLGEAKVIIAAHLGEGAGCGLPRISAAKA